MIKAPKGCFICQVCKEAFPKKPGRQFYCTPCGVKKKYYYEKTEVIEEKKLCTVCGSPFKSVTKNQKICSKVCRENKAGKESIDKWINKKERVFEPARGALLDRMRVKKKYTAWMRKYNACPG